MLNKKVWIDGETKAEKFLIKQGYKIIDKNCKIGGSEIDIVAILPKKQQKSKLMQEFKQNKHEGRYTTKEELKFFKKVLMNNIKELNDMLVFVEVKARFSKKYGYPYEAVDKEKQHNLERGCVAYIKNKKMNMQARIDVISVIDDEIVHIENAFDVKLY